MLRGDKRGVMLLDAMIALAILSTVMVVLIGLGGNAYTGLSRAREAEREMADAHRVLGALSLLTRNEYDQRLGVRTLGSYLVEVTRPERGLYRIGLRPVEHPMAELLVTIVFRPDTNS